MNKHDKALDILDGMLQIADNEMITKGIYYKEECERPDLKDQICGGHRACLIGSMWVAALVRPKKLEYWDELTLPGVEYGEDRDEFLKRRPGLRLAYNALNEAAERRLVKISPDWEKNEVDFSTNNVGADAGPAEFLFENTDFGTTRGDLKRLIRSAIKVVEKA